MPNGQHCNKHFNFMSDVVHHITMDHVGGPGKNSSKSLIVKNQGYFIKI